jgi:tetratricopeptide (TPR) repeat protein
MAATDRFSPQDVQRILGLTEKQLDYWERLELVSPLNDNGIRSYDFRDLIGLRTVKQLAENGVPPGRLRRALTALRARLSHAAAPLSELRILSDGKDVIVERGSSRLEPVSGQFVMNFETREIGERVRVMTGHSADEWFAAALEYDADDRRKAEAIDAYERALCVNPNKIEVLLNCGALHYESGSLHKAADYFKRVVQLDRENILANFNLGSVLDELGRPEMAREHLRAAVRLDPHYADAHYNLAFVCERLTAFKEAQQHWEIYVNLEPIGPWSDYARRRLAAMQPARSAVRR